MHLQLSIVMLEITANTTVPLATVPDHMEEIEAVVRDKATIKIVLKLENLVNRVEWEIHYAQVMVEVGWVQENMVVDLNLLTMVSFSSPKRQQRTWLKGWQANMYVLGRVAQVPTLLSLLKDKEEKKNLNQKSPDTQKM